jgi:hypothetical protein
MFGPVKEDDDAADQNTSEETENQSVKLMTADDTLSTADKMEHNQLK